jgi:hypothetical protein
MIQPPQNKWVRYKQCAAVIVEKLTMAMMHVTSGQGQGGPVFFYKKQGISNVAL